MRVLCTLALMVLAAAADESPALRELVKGNVQFSANTYKELASTNPGKNFLVSPLSVATVLALSEAGAGGKTAQELISGLSLPDTEEKIHEAFKAIAPGLNVDAAYTLSSANKVYLKKGYKIKQQFKQVATQYFNAEVDEIEFTKNDAAAQINKWVLDKTHEKISDLISQNDLTALTRVILINALYFHGNWVKTFKIQNTSEKPFRISSTKTYPVKMMEQTGSFDYYEDHNLKVKYLEMSYTNSPVSMVFVLPDDVDGLAALEANIEKVLDVPKFGYARVHVQIPHVKVEQKIDFIPILQKLGVNEAFGDKADFSRLIEGNENLYISKVIQKTFIAVEEKGTTAAAATAVVFERHSAAILPPEIPKEFNADHPFIFILKHPNGILFVGRYIEPENHA